MYDDGIDHEEMALEAALFPWLDDPPQECFEPPEGYTESQEGWGDEETDEWDEWCEVCDRPLGECPDECHEDANRFPGFPDAT